MREEKSIIAAFVHRNQRDELLKLCAKEDDRIEFVKQLCDAKKFEERTLTRVPDSERLGEKVGQLLAALGAPARAYLISENDEVDGRQAPLSDLLAEVIGSGYAAIISCIPGKLAYFESADGEERFLLRK